MSLPWSLTDQRLTLYCHIQPAARNSQLIGLYDGRIKIQLKSPPVDGKANRTLIDFLAQLSNRPRSAISIRRGLNQRRKTIIIEGIGEIPQQFVHLIEAQSLELD